MRADDTSATGAGGLDAAAAQALLAELLAGAVEPGELAAPTGPWPPRPATLAETTGFVRALDAHTARLDVVADAVRPVLLPAGRGTRRHANLTALVALLLQRYGIPVVVHGWDPVPHVAAADARGTDRCTATGDPVTTTAVFRELGVAPASTLAEAQARLARGMPALVPLAVLAPGLARLLARPDRHASSAVLRVLAKLVDPFGGRGYRVIGVHAADQRAAIRAFLLASEADALLLDGAEDEPFPAAGGESTLECIAGGRVAPCVEPDDPACPHDAPPGTASDAPATAAWIAEVLAGRQPPPPAIVGQLGCCLAGVRSLGRCG